LPSFSQLLSGQSWVGFSWLGSAAFPAFRSATHVVTMLTFGYHSSYRSALPLYGSGLIESLVHLWRFLHAATSTDGSLHYCGPFKDFPAHHMNTSSPVTVENLFGHSPAGKKRVP
jgi:hypothetical protein